MKEIKRVAKGFGKAVLAVLGGIFFPILIWIALGVVIAAMVTATKQRLGEQRHQQVRVRAIGKLSAPPVVVTDPLSSE